MVARAEACGVSLFVAHSGQRFASGGCGDPANQVVRARWVVGADGGQSLVRQWAGLDGYCYERTRFCVSPGIIEFPRGVTAGALLGSEMPDLCQLRLRQTKSAWR